VSDFLANLARRGAGLAPHVPLQPSLTPFVSPEAAVADPIERGMEDHLDTGGPTPPTQEPGSVASAAGGIEREAGESLGITTASEPMVQRQIAAPSTAQPAPVPAAAPSPPIPAPAEPALSQAPPAAAGTAPEPATTAPNLDSVEEKPTGADKSTPPVQPQDLAEATPTPSSHAAGEPAPLPTPPHPAAPPKVAPRLDEPGLVQPKPTDIPGPTAPAGSLEPEPGREQVEPSRAPEPSRAAAPEPARPVEPKRAAQAKKAEISPSQRAPAPPAADSAAAPAERGVERILEAESGPEVLPPQQAVVEAGPVLPIQAPASPALAAEEPPRGKPRRSVSPAPPPAAPGEIPEPPAQPAGFPVEMPGFPAASADEPELPGLTQIPASPSSAVKPSSRTPALLPSIQATARVEERAVQIEPALPPPVNLELAAAKQQSPASVEAAASATTAGPQPVQIHIGTVEVRATTPPPAPAPRPAPAPQGFDDYVQIRTYVNREF
jgi:hypothetical protein